MHEIAVPIPQYRLVIGQKMHPTQWLITSRPAFMWLIDCSYTVTITSYIIHNTYPIVLGVPLLGCPQQVKDSSWMLKHQDKILLSINDKWKITKVIKSEGGSSLVPRPSPAPVFDRLQYAKTEGEGLVNLTT